MKIASIIDKIAVSGGAERVMCELSNALAERGHEVHLITRTTPTGESYFVSDRVTLKDTFVRCKIPGLRNMIRNSKLHKMLKKNKYDVAVSFITSMNVQAILTAIGTGVPMVVSERVDPRVVAGTWTGFKRSLTYPMASGFVFQTNEALEFFSKKIQSRAEVIPNPLLTTLPEKTSYATTGRIVTMGRLTKQKNYPLMLRSFSRFLQSHAGYTLEIYGKGELLSELQEYARSLGIEEYVKFMGQRSDVHDCIKDADMFLMTSDYEGMSNALAEAMVIGLPCVATDCSGGGASFLMEDCVNGRLVGRGDEDALTAALNAFAEDEALRRSMGEAAKQLSLKLDRVHVFNTWEDYLSRVASKKKENHTK